MEDKRKTPDSKWQHALNFFTPHGYQQFPMVGNFLRHWRWQPGRPPRMTWRTMTAHLSSQRIPGREQKARQTILFMQKAFSDILHILHIFNMSDILCGHIGHIGHIDELQNIFYKYHIFNILRDFTTGLRASSKRVDARGYALGIESLGADGLIFFELYWIVIEAYTHKQNGQTSLCFAYICRIWEKNAEYVKEYVEYARKYEFIMK